MKPEPPETNTVLMFAVFCTVEDAGLFADGPRRFLHSASTNGMRAQRIAEQEWRCFIDEAGRVGGDESDTRREAMWIAFSDFWLDTELTESDYAALVRVARESGYDLAELETIFTEVGPIVASNLSVVAGVWDGFDPVWLVDRIRRRRRYLDAIRGRWWFRWMLRHPDSRKRRFGVAREWDRFVRLFREATASDAGGGDQSGFKIGAR